MTRISSFLINGGLISLLISGIAANHWPHLSTFISVIGAVIVIALVFGAKAISMRRIEGSNDAKRSIIEHKPLIDHLVVPAYSANQDNSVDIYKRIMKEKFEIPVWTFTKDQNFLVLDVKEHVKIGKFGIASSKEDLVISHSEREVEPSLSKVRGVNFSTHDSNFAEVLVQAKQMLAERPAHSAKVDTVH